jgi:hypothetical protein
MDIDQFVTTIRDLMQPESDITLFKFRAIDSILDRLLLDQEIYFSPPQKLNDPFDCQHDLLKSLRRAIARKDACRPDLLKALLIYEEDLRTIENSAQFAGVCAFSTNLKNPLLWSHYA